MQNTSRLSDGLHLKHMPLKKVDSFFMLSIPCDLFYAVVFIEKRAMLSTIAWYNGFLGCENVVCVSDMFLCLQQPIMVM